MFLWNFFHNSMAFCISSTDSKKETRSILHIFVATFSNFMFCNKTHIGAAQLFSHTAPICVLIWRFRADLNRRIKVLQTSALPLGYGAIWSGLRGSNSLPPPWQGGALPDELNPRIATSSGKVVYKDQRKKWRPGWVSNPRPLA